MLAPLMLSFCHCVATASTFQVVEAAGLRRGSAVSSSRTSTVPTGSGSGRSATVADAIADGEADQSSSTVWPCSGLRRAEAPLSSAQQVQPTPNGE